MGGKRLFKGAIVKSDGHEAAISAAI